MSLLCKIEDKILLSNMNEENIRLNREESEEDHLMLSTNDHDEKRMRRQIANSNERRRMQSINAGFQSLRQLLPHHEGEKLSKAAILQQTAEYIYNLEQEKTRLLSQNCQLKRLLDSNDGVSSEIQTSGITTTSSSAASAINGVTNSTMIGKKRKVDIFALQTISDSSDEGLGSMSPEPVSLVTLNSGSNGGGGNGKLSATSNNNITAKDYLDIKHQLEIARRQKAQMQEELRQLESQLYSERNRTIQYKSQQEIIEHTSDNMMSDEIDGIVVPNMIDTEDEDAEEMQKMSVDLVPEHQQQIHIQQQQQTQQHQDAETLQMYTIESIQSSNQVIVCSMVDEATTRDLSPINNAIKEEKIIITTNRQSSKSPLTSLQIVEKPIQQLHIQHHHHHHHHSQSQQQQQNHIKRIPTILETVIKAEPKVEVERIGSPSSIIVTTTDETSAIVQRPAANGTTGASSAVPATTAQRGQMYHIGTNTSRQNLETIVEAIRHLEGDNAFENVEPQEVPLALTTTNKQHREHTKLQQQKSREHRQIQIDINPYLQFRKTNGVVNSSTDSNVSAIPTATVIPAVSIQQIGAVPTVVTQQKITQIITTIPPPATSTIVTSAASIHQQQQCRPGVIVVKQNS